MKLQALKPAYEVPRTDDQEFLLTVKYNKGEVREIKDYGAVGSFGLSNLMISYLLCGPANIGVSEIDGSK